MSHLLDIGHTDVACITGIPPRLRRPRALRGLCQPLCGAAASSVNPDYVVDGDWNETKGYSAMLRLLSLERPPTAVYSCNYNMTVGALRLLKEHGLSVPDDLSLVELRRRSALFSCTTPGSPPWPSPSPRSPRTSRA